MSSLSVADLPTASGEVLCGAVIRREPADFQVTEMLSPTEQNEGEHLWLWVEKAGANTQWVATALADHFKVRRRDVAYAGLKDRHAITRQWFSVWLPGGQKRGDPVLPEHAEYQVLTWRWQAKKIRRGLHDGNRFDLLLRDVDLSTAILEPRLAAIAASGVPNYYGQQRFGYSFDPQPERITWSEDRFTRGMQLSAVRSYLFNMQLAERVLANTWRVVDLPSWLCWRGSNAGFIAERLDERLEGLLATGELSPSAWLPGLVEDPRLAAQPSELTSLASHRVWLDQLEERRVLAARRATILPVRGLAHELNEQGLQLTFELPPGAFATTVLNELFAIKDEARLAAQTSLDED
ncbi:tRNA pseudouridine(13) synthase TruD [Salinispirillum sp. LH 10-3-1]|uniref:tRNA pseudouridine synthase D n=1 Tax=Salinispirillum sp. LH 10-3-1 TaxID=2952525 RepID=A0AB38YIW3_9GAMM